MIFSNAFQFLLAVSVMASSVEARELRKKVKEGTIFDPVVPGVEATDTGTDEPAVAELLYTPDDKFVDDICVKYCNDYFFTYCQHHNLYVNRRRRRRLQEAGEWNPQEEFQRSHGRSLVETEEKGSARGGDYSKGLQDCHETCMIWPRPLDPMDYWNSVGRETYYTSFDTMTSNLGGDTFWCRERHMTMTAIFEDGANNGIGDNFQGGFQSSASFHCSLANPDGAGICQDATIGKTKMSPYELERTNQKSRVHLGYCDVIDNGKIVDCSGQNTIATSNLDVVLGTFPDNMEILFLNGIEGITTLPSGIFAANLKSPLKLKALFINGCDITGALNVAGQSPFRGLNNLEVLNMDENRNLNVVNSGLLNGLTKLKQFAMFDASIVTLPDDMFDDCKATLEVMTIYCLPGPQDKLGSNAFFHEDFFRGMKNLVTMSFVFCAFDTDDVTDDTMFDDLESLKWFDFNGDEGFKVLKNRWFNCEGCGGSKMGQDLVRFAMWGTGLTDDVFQQGGVGDKVFQNLDKLEAAWFFNSFLTEIPELYLKDKDHFESISIGLPITGQLPPTR